ncbi:hypothetical protein BC941DRAFT_410129 [Chlamydoabsidia padenii]|nr:hypothetical protein BC941DRAFT_410129 [Chlamydoabsidia padenii]
MGSTISKAKQQLSFKTTQPKTMPSCSSHTERHSLMRSTNKSIPRSRKSKHQRQYHVGKVSAKRSKPKYRNVTKSIIGKPTNFKHTNHLGAGDILASSVDTMALSNELYGIANQLDCFESQVQNRELPHSAHDVIQTPLKSTCSLPPPPPPPPHLFISASAKKRASKDMTLSGILSVVPVSFRRRQYRKAVSRHHPNLGLVNALMIETSTMRSITAA